MAKKSKQSFAPKPAEPPLVVSSPDAAQWDEVADVLVVGFGGAGACAAIEARERGADVLVLDRFHGGGATAISGGVVYAGGGSHIQAEAGVEDSVDEMLKYLRMEVQGVVSDETLQRFCEESIDNLRWIEGHGVPFEGSLCPFKTSYPTDDYFLYSSGNEGMRPFRDEARPAARGHRAKGVGMPGANFYEPLRHAAQRAGVRAQYEARVSRLITDEENQVVGVEYQQIKPRWKALHRRLNQAAIQIVKYQPKIGAELRARCFEIEAKQSVTKRARARGGVVLAAGGFIYNREMVEEHAPAYRCAMPLGTASDNGSGIKLGQSVGGAVDRMGRVSAWRFINPPEAFAKGILINRQGERYINEFRYGAAIGEAMVDDNDGVALLVIDQELKDLAREQSRPGQAQWFQRAPALLNLWFNCRRGDTVADLAKAAKVPAQNLERTLQAYNDAADGKTDDPFGKDRDKMHAMPKGPYYVIDCSIDSKRFPCPTLTLGGLVVDEQSGLVRRSSEEPIRGLYAAGRTAVGVCSRQYVSGLSIADCVFSGRRAGAHAATIGLTTARQQPHELNGSTVVPHAPSAAGAPMSTTETGSIARNKTRNNTYPRQPLRKSIRRATSMRPKAKRRTLGKG